MITIKLVYLIVLILYLPVGILINHFEKITPPEKDRYWIERDGKGFFEHGVIIFTWPFLISLMLCIGAIYGVINGVYMAFEYCFLDEHKNE